MKMDDLIAALGSGTHELYPAASEEDVKMTQAAIERPLPGSYRTFVRNFSNGAYLYTLQEVSAVGAGNEQIAPIRKIDWLAGDRDDVISIREGGETVHWRLEELASKRE